MGSQGFSQRFAAFDFFQDIVDYSAERRLGSQFGCNCQAAIQWKTGTDKRGKLFREKQNIFFVLLTLSSALFLVRKKIITYWIILQSMIGAIFSLYFVYIQ